MPDTDLTPVSAQVYEEPPGGPETQVQSMTMTPARRLRVDIVAAPAAPIPVHGEAEALVWVAANSNILMGQTYPVDPDDGRFGIHVGGIPALLGSIKEFTIHAAIHTTGNGWIIIEYMTSAAGAWHELDRLPLAVAQAIVKRYAATAERYRVYYLADVNTTGFDGNVYLKPQT